MLADTIPVWVPVERCEVAEVSGAEGRFGVFALDCSESARGVRAFARICQQHAGVLVTCRAWVPLPGEDIRATRHMPEWHPLITLSVAAWAPDITSVPEALAFTACVVCDAEVLAQCETSQEVGILLGPVGQEPLLGLEDERDELRGRLCVTPLDARALMRSQLEAYRRAFAQ